MTETVAGLDVGVLAPRGRDGERTRELLEQSGIGCLNAATLDDILAGIDDGAYGAVVLAEEAVSPDGWIALAVALERQPAWSDLPIVLLTYRTRATVDAAFALGVNMTLIERPVHSNTLIVTVRSALRTRRRQYELRDLLHRTDELVRRLGETDRRKDEFLAALSHELRTPMAAIRNGVEVLRLSLPPAGPHERPIEIIGRQMQNLKRLVDDLLDVSRVTTGKIVLNRRTVDLRDVVRRSVQALDDDVRVAGHDLHVSFAPRATWVWGDAVRLEQVIGNLITNAIKYTRSGGGHIDVKVTREGKEAVVRVRDNGIGIDAETLPRVFELFAQAAQPLDRTRGGLGIGLHLVQTLVRHHGGIIEVNSEGEGKGSEFVVRLPLATEPPPPPPPPSPRPGRSAVHAAAAAPLSIVIVEDNADAREMLVEALRYAGHDVESAGDGVSGLRLLKHRRPDIALVDLGLPGLDGYAVARRMRALDPECRTRLVAISGYAQPRDRERAREAGFDDHMVKPVQIDILNQRLRTLHAEPHVANGH